MKQISIKAAFGIVALFKMCTWRPVLTYSGSFRESAAVHFSEAVSRRTPEVGSSYSLGTDFLENDPVDMQTFNATL